MTKNPQVTTEVKMVGPKEAQDLLKNNTDNRKITQHTIHSYSAAMSQGMWLFDGAPIRLSTDGRLLDGQQRLHAVIESNTKQPFLIVTGIEEDAQTVMDTGRKRTLANALAMHGEVNTQALGALVNVVYRWERGIRSNALFGGTMGNSVFSYPSHPVLLQFFQEHRDQIVAALDMGEFVDRKVHVSPRVHALAYYVTSQVDNDDAEHFFTRLKEGTNLEKGSPIYVLREQLLGLDVEVHQRRFYYHTLAYIFKAWNSYRAGESPQIYRFRPGGQKPEIFPEPM